MSKQFRQLVLPTSVMLVILTVGTVVHGLLTDRFGMIVTDELEEFTSRLEHVPHEIGDWKGEDVLVDPREIAAANVTGHVSRTFTNRETGATVNMFLVCGTSRHITLHTPDRCYQAQGFRLQREPATIKLDVGRARSDSVESPEFADGLFFKEESGNVQQLRILWSFSDGITWQGPTEARTALAGKNALYKIYVIGPGLEESSDRKAAAVRFLQDAIPTLQKVLFEQQGHN